jgi:hypothetical protein
MICIEFTLNLNHMENVIRFPDPNPGQLIPLLIGIASLLLVSYIILRNRWGWTRDEEESNPCAEGSSDQKYTEGLGLIMTHTNSSYLSPRTNSPPEAEAIAKPPLRGAIGPFPPHLQLLHRFLFAWLPWLGLFSFFRHPFSPFYSRVGSGVATHDPNAEYDEMRPLRSQNRLWKRKVPKPRCWVSPRRYSPISKVCVSGCQRSAK